MDTCPGPCASPWHMGSARGRRDEGCGRQTEFVGGSAAAGPGVTGTVGDCTHTGTRTQPCTRTHRHTHARASGDTHGSVLTGTEASWSPWAASAVAEGSRDAREQGGSSSAARDSVLGIWVQWQMWGGNHGCRCRPEPCPPPPKAARGAGTKAAGPGSGQQRRKEPELQNSAQAAAGRLWRRVIIVIIVIAITIQ